MCHMAIYYRKNQISLFVCTFDLPFFIFNLRPLTEFLILLFCIIFLHSWYASWSFLISSRTNKGILRSNIVVLSCTVQVTSITLVMVDWCSAWLCFVCGGLFRCSTKYGSWLHYCILHHYLPRSSCFSLNIRNSSDSAKLEDRLPFFSPNTANK